MALATETELKRAYREKATAAGYVERRFTSEVHRLLHERQVGAVQRAVDRLRPRRVLEIAPGPGRVTRDLRSMGALVCLEYNEAMIREGRRACRGRAQWVRGNGFELPFAQAFDLVYSFRFIRHFHRPDRERLYAGIRRVLNQGGCFITDAVNRRVSQPWRDAEPESFPIYDELYDADELRRELGAAGLEVVSLQPVQKFYRWQLWSQVFVGPRAGWLNRLVIRVLERLPGRNGLEWVVTCRRA